MSAPLRGLARRSSTPSRSRHLAVRPGLGAGDDLRSRAPVWICVPDAAQQDRSRPPDASPTCPTKVDPAGMPISAVMPSGALPAGMPSCRGTRLPLVTHAPMRQPRSADASLASVSGGPASKRARARGRTLIQPGHPGAETSHAPRPNVKVRQARSQKDADVAWWSRRPFLHVDVDVE